MTDLTLTRVVLYKIGVGFFEKKGTIDLSKEKHVEISLKNSTVNDLLKTFSIMRTKGDLIVTGVSYTGQDTNQAKMLQDSLINLPEENTIQALLSQLRGIEVEIGSSSAKVEKGIIIGTQNRPEPVGEKSLGIIDQMYITLKKTDGSIQTLPIKEIQFLKIKDSIVNNDLKFFLDVIRSGKNEKTRNISIYFDGKSESEFYLNFIQDTPAWKCSYRLFLLGTPDIATNKEEFLEREILLQGWAIIDNVLNENFENVRLVLMSGMPISFKYDSYSPLWIDRPVVERTERLEVSTPDKNIVTRVPVRSPVTEKPREEKGVSSTGEVVTAIMQNTVSKGSGFEYRIPTLVNVKRNQSSLIPLLQNKGKAKLVSVYNESVDTFHPMQTLEIINNTGLVLETGPISIFNDNIFEGEAVLPFMEKEEQQRIPYSVDQAIDVHKKIDTKYQKYHDLSVYTYVYQKRYIDKLTTYKITNISENREDIDFEHPKESDYKIYEPEKADEESRNYYRFRISLKPSETTELTIKERRLASDYVYFNSLSKDLVQNWFADKLITEKIYKFLITYVELMIEKNEIQIKINELIQHKQGITDEQARIRKTLDILGTSSSEETLKSRYIKKFDTGEAEIDAIDKKVAEYQLKIQEIDKKLTSMNQTGAK